MNTLFGHPIKHPITRNVIWDEQRGMMLPPSLEKVKLKEMSFDEFLSEPRTLLLVIYNGTETLKVGKLPADFKI